MPKKNQVDKSIIGKKFGKLTVLEFLYTIQPTEEDKKQDSYWLCKCDCGKEKIARRKSLVRPNKGTKSCGCLLKKPKNRPCSMYEDLTGKKFNKLTVVKRLGKNKKNNYIWECLCDCGKTVICITSKLKFGSTKSCGCIKKTCRTINLIGQKFGSFTVLKRVYTKTKKCDLGKWQCKCDCGNIKEILTRELKNKKINYCQKCRNYYGENNGNWNPNITNEERFSIRRLDPKVKIWKKKIYKRDNWKCQITGRKGKICAHHLESWNSNKKLRYRISNGITILISLHKAFHKKYGYGNNTRKQFKEFIKNLTKEQTNTFI